MTKRFRTENGVTWLVRNQNQNSAQISLEGKPNTEKCLSIDVQKEKITHSCMRIFLDSEKGRTRYWFHSERNKKLFSWHGGSLELTEEEWANAAGVGSRRTYPLRLTMPGKVVDIKVKEGDMVEKGQCLLIVEAMKMENNLLAENSARIKKIHVKKEDRLEAGAILISFEPL